MKKQKEQIPEEWIRDALQHRAEQIQVSQEDIAGLCRKIHERTQEGTGMTRKWNWKKTVIIAAAVCVLGSVTAIGGGRIVGITSHSYHSEEVGEYGQMKELAAKQEMELKVPETFSNGYTFESAVPVYETGQDEEGNDLASSQALSLIYVKDGEPDIFISAQRVPIGELGDVDQTFEYNGMTMFYSKDHYRMVPPDYEISEEEQALIDEGSLVVSYGTDQVEDREYQFLCWENEGIHYILSVFDSRMTAENMAQMAGEM